MVRSPFGQGCTFGGDLRRWTTGLVAGAAVGLGVAAGPAAAAVMFSAGAGSSLTVTGVDGDPDALSAVRITGVQAQTQVTAGVNGRDDDHSFETARSFEVEPSSFGTAEATTSAFALSRTIDPAAPPANDPLTGSGLFQLADIEGSASALGGGFVDVSAEAGAFGRYEITNDWHRPIRVHFDYELGLAALAQVDDPARELANASASVEIRRSDANGVVFADVVGPGEDGQASGSFFVEVPGYGSSSVIALAEALGEATVVPIPATALLLAPALAALSWARRRQQGGVRASEAAA